MDTVPKQLPPDLQRLTQPVRWFPAGLNLLGVISLVGVFVVLNYSKSAIHEILATLVGMTGVFCFVAAEIIRLLADIAERKN